MRTRRLIVGPTCRLDRDSCNVYRHAITFVTRVFHSTLHPRDSRPGAIRSSLPCREVRAAETGAWIFTPPAHGRVAVASIPPNLHHTAGDF